MNGPREGSEPETAGGPAQATTAPGGKADAAPGEKADAAPGEKAPAAGRTARILILEDDPWDAELAQRLLTGAGLDFTAVVVETRASFTEQLAAFRPDLILSDFHLPGFSGEMALEIAQERCPQIPFIIWSGVLGDEAAVGLIKQGATDYILKDRPARLASAIQRALAEAEQRAYLAQLEDQLFAAQRLASLGQLAAAEEAVSRTRHKLAAARRQATAADPPP
jgi:DNA-binding NtrC family response regulator